MAYIELRSKDGLTEYPVEQLQHFTFNCERSDRANFTLRLGLVKQGFTYYFCISKSDKDIKSVVNGCNGYRDQTTWKPFNERMIRDLVPDYIDWLSRSDRKLYRQLLNQFIESNEKKFSNTY
ncbi:hypothetical protein MYOV057v1_p0025 [Vibrio phage 184E37.1]|nr:hypothetical protein MYOV057v1_p0025 [Vibrio phage 184E37.1]